MRRFWIWCIVALVPATGHAGAEIVSNPARQTVSVVIQSTDSRTALRFSLGGLTLEPVSLAEHEFTRIVPVESERSDFGLIGEPGQPQLPVYSEWVIIPDQLGVQVNVLSWEFETYDSIRVAPAQPFALENSQEAAPFTIDEPFYRQDEFFPQELVEVSEPMIIRDFRCVQVMIHPVQFNPATGELRVYTNISYELDYSGSDSANIKTRRDNHISEAFVPIYRALFANADEILADYEAIRGGYLIVAPAAYNFADTITALARWKHLKGYYTQIARSTDINPSGAPTSTQVFNYILNAYQTWDVPPDFVLLVGDQDQQIPDYIYGGYHSDHQYSTVDGSDFISDIFVARLSVDNMTELRTAMTKILLYEKTPSMTDPGYWKRGLGVAGNIGASSPRIMNLWVRDIAMEHGYTRVDTVFDWGSGAPNWSTINTAINNGVSYVSYRGWAGPSGWYNPSWGVSDIYALTNSFRTGIMASIVCGTGDFGVDPCFGEAWIRAGTPTLPRGGVSFYGCTDHSTHTAWNNPNITGFFAALFEQDMNHFAQLMLMGKLRIMATFPTFTQYLQQYFNTYNSLGDPELEVRTEIPRQLTASYPPAIPVGTNFMAVNVASDMSPVEGAYVNLTKGYSPNEEIFVGGRTNASGSVTLSYENTVADTIFVTVTGRDYVPYLGFCLSTAEAVALGSDSVTIDDDGIGGTSGNADGKPNPNETLGLGIELRNFGSSQTATGVSADVASSDPRVNITTSHQIYPDIPYGGSAFPVSQFVAELSPDIPHGETILLTLSINSNEGNWRNLVQLDVNSIKPAAIAISYPGDSNNRLDPGESSNLVVQFQNAGGLDGRNITGVLSTQDRFIEITESVAVFGDVNVGDTVSNGATPFSVTVSDTAYNGRNVNLTVNFTSNIPGIGDILFARTFSVVVGHVTGFDPAGPDNYGHYMYDNTDMNYEPAPIYEWVEINPNLGGSGTRINPPNSDDASALLALPFVVRYYGHDYGHMIVSTNGFVAFDTIPYDQAGNYWHNWDNWPIPDPGNARAQISPFWDDLIYSGSTNGLYSYHDTANGRLIIEWSGMTHRRTGSPQTFELMIYDSAMHPTPTGGCEIVFQYNVINNDDYNASYSHPESYSSVGFENWEQNDGIQYEYDNVYHPAAAILESGRAIKITTATGLAVPPDMSFEPGSFGLFCAPGDHVDASLIFHNDGGGSLFYAISTEIIDRTARSRSIASPPGTIEEQVSDAAKSDVFPGPYNPPVILDEGGPDNFGYTWIDSNEPDGPVYNWIDITSIGTLINWPGDRDDGVITDIPIGFQFPFYGSTYASMNVCTNGFVSFTSNVTAFSNVSIPNGSDPNSMLAIYWDDLNFEPRGNAYYYSNNVDSFVIAFVGVPHFADDGLFTFEAILQRSGKITYQYQQASGIDVNQETVGIENATGTDGLLVTYNAPYIVPGLAVRFTAGWWLSVTPSSGVVSPHTSDTVTVRCDASELEAGQYEGILHVQTNDPDQQTFDIPVLFTVTSCSYAPGDVNGDSLVSIADVVYCCSYFRGDGATPPDSCWNDSTSSWFYPSLDANGNCEVLGSDLTYLVYYFRGLNPQPAWCPQVPPPGGATAGKQVLHQEVSIKKDDNH